MRVQKPESASDATTHVYFTLFTVSRSKYSHLSISKLILFKIVKRKSVQRCKYKIAFVIFEYIKFIMEKVFSGPSFGHQCLNAHSLNESKVYRTALLFYLKTGLNLDLAIISNDNSFFGKKYKWYFLFNYQNIVTICERLRRGRVRE